MKGLFFRARTRALSSRSAGTAGTAAFGAKQALLPFIKLIHPDMFALAAPQVKVANLRCVQTVYELWEALGHVEQSSVGKDFTLPKPLRPAYELTCYVRGGEGAEPQRVVFTLQTPPALTRQQSLSVSVARIALRQVKKQLSGYFIAAGAPEVLPVPKPDETEYGDGDGGDDGSRGRSLDSVFPTPSPRQAKSLNAQLDAILFDRHVSARHHSTPYSSILSSSPYPSARSLAQKRTTKLLDAHVQSFMRSSQLLVRGLAPEEELAAVQRLRQFLLDYGQVLGFSHATWGSVVLLLHKPDGAKPSGAAGAAAGEGEKDAASAQHEQVLARKGFQCDKRSDGLFLVHIPHRFREGDLLEFLRLKLPMTSPFASVPPLNGS